MKKKIQDFVFYLWYCKVGCTNEKELKLISLLEDLVDQAEFNKPLDQDRLGGVRNKVKKVGCFGEKYNHIYEFLNDYHKNYQVK